MNELEQPTTARVMPRKKFIRQIIIFFCLTGSNLAFGSAMPADPPGFPGGLNFYAYSNGNPASYIDPFGFSAAATGDSDNSWYYNQFINQTPTTFQTDGFDKGAAFAQSVVDAPAQIAVANGLPPWMGGVIMMAVFPPEGAALMAETATADAVDTTVAVEAGQTTTVIGRMADLDQFADNPAIDTWAKSGRIPNVGAGDPPVLWEENQAWLDARIARGDNFGIATDPATLPPVTDGFIPGQPNGYFTARELQYLQQNGITVTPMH